MLLIRHLSKIISESDGVCLCSNWLENNTNGQNSDGA